MADKAAARNPLSLKRKVEIIDYAEKNKHKQKRQIAAELHVPASTLSKIIKDKQKFLHQYETGKTNPHQKRDKRQEKRFWKKYRWMGKKAGKKRIYEEKEHDRKEEPKIYLTAN